MIDLGSNTSNGVFILSEPDTRFEKEYLKVRQKEGRIYSDNEVLSLPNLSQDHPQYKEWRMRSQSTKRVIKYFNNADFISVLDLGCGNGWFTNQLAAVASNVIGVDVNLQELSQAHKLFNPVNLSFCYADIWACELPKNHFNAITLNACFQYFPQPEKLFFRLKELLTKHGEIHIIDSPFYSSEQVEAAKTRTDRYYKKLGFPAMANHYFHHSWAAMDGWKYKVLYRPETLVAKLTRKLGNHDSPFPWICIKT